MKSLTSFFFILTLAVTVSCGGDKKKSSDRISSNPYQASTFNALYTPTKQYQIYYGGRWYSLQPFSQQSQQQIAQIQQVTAQQIMSGTGQYPITVLSNVPMFRVRVTGALGGGYAQQYPQQQYPTQYPQQYPQQPAASGSVSVQSIQLY